MTTTQPVVNLSLSTELMRDLSKVVHGKVSRVELLTLGLHKLKERLEREAAEHEKNAFEADKEMTALFTEEVALKVLRASRGLRRLSSEVRANDGTDWNKNKYLRVKFQVSLYQEEALELMPKKWVEAMERSKRETELYRAKRNLIHEIQRQRKSMKLAIIESTLRATPEGQKVLGGLDDLMGVFHSKVLEEKAKQKKALEQ